MASIEKWIRPDLIPLITQEIEQKEYSLQNSYIKLDKNENPFNSPYNRYDENQTKQLVELLSKTYATPAENILPTNGSAEAIDLILKMCCFAGSHNIIGVEPCRSIYKKMAKTQGISYKKVGLNASFNLEVNEILHSFNNHTKIIFINNPCFATGKTIEIEKIIRIAKEFNGAVVIDYSYANFSIKDTWSKTFKGLENIILINSLSRAWGLANCRIGFIMAHQRVTKVLEQLQMSYSISTMNAQTACSVLQKNYTKEQWKRAVLPERSKFMLAITMLENCVKVYATESDFFLAEFTDSEQVCKDLQEKGIRVKNMMQKQGCKNCLRISMGTKEENNKLISALRKRI